MISYLGAEYRQGVMADSQTFQDFRVVEIVVFLTENQCSLALLSEIWKEIRVLPLFFFNAFLKR